MNTGPRKAVVVAGPNGSGKTTFAREYLETYPMEYLSADEIAAELAPRPLQEVRLQAGRSFFTRILDRIANGRSFLAETTFAGKSFRRVLRQLQQAGYSVTVVFVFLDSAEMCVARVRERVRKGGHSVPETDIIRRFHRSVANFWNLYRDFADRWHLVYNASTQFQEVAIGDADGVTLHDEALYQRFLEIVKEQQGE